MYITYEAMGVDLCMSRRGPAPEELDLSMFKQLEFGRVLSQKTQQCAQERVRAHNATPHVCPATFLILLTWQTCVQMISRVLHNRVPHYFDVRTWMAHTCFMHVRAVGCGGVC